MLCMCERACVYAMPHSAPGLESSMVDLFDFDMSDVDLHDFLVGDDVSRVLASLGESLP